MSLSPPPFVYRSHPMRRLVADARTAAGAGQHLLVVGEAGTGKRRLARWIRQVSPRGTTAILRIDCSQAKEITPLLADFSRHRVAAKRGVVILDGIDQTPTEQRDRLRYCLNSRFEVDNAGALVIATSRRPRGELEATPGLRELVRAIQGLDLVMPPLRDRRTDIPRLVRVLVEDVSDGLGRSSKPPTGDALDALIHYGWPGNVTELEHALERAVISAKQGGRIEIGDLPRSIRGVGLEPGVAAIQTLAEVERLHILATLQACGNNRQATADALGIGVNTLWRRLKDYRNAPPRPRRP